MPCQAAAAGRQAVRHHGPVTSIHLRPISESDLPVLDWLAVDPGIAGPFDWHGFGDPGARRRRLAEDGFLGRDPRNLAIALDQDDSCIGDVSWPAVPTGPTSACWNIRIVIVPEFRGQGYGTAAQRLLTGYLFATTTANRSKPEPTWRTSPSSGHWKRPGSSARASGADRSSETASGGIWRYTAVSAMIRTSAGH
jgi:GNAT superfamily N-acetyltransferase